MADSVVIIRAKPVLNNNSRFATSIVKGTITGLGYKPEPINSKSKDGKKVYAIDENTAPYVKRIFEMYTDENKTMAQIIRYLNEAGVKTSTGSPFNKSSISRILQSKKYIGTYIYQDMEFPEN